MVGSLVEESTPHTDDYYPVIDPDVDKEVRINKLEVS